MDLSHARLLVHHHSVAYSDAAQRIWLPSFFGRWIDSLASHFKEIGLVVHESSSHSEFRQDYKVTRENVNVVSLGPPGRTWDRIPRMRRIRAACRSASDGATGLLIRGVTPRQHSVWRSVGLRTAYLLVGTLQDVEGVSSGLGLPWRLYQAMARRVRAHGLALIAQQAVMLANSPGLVDEVKKKYGCRAEFVPTNTISRSEFPPLNIRPHSCPLRLLFCGRVVEDKGIREAIEAVGELRSAGTTCVLDVVGPVAGVFRNQLESLAARCGAQGAVTFHGAVPYGPALFEFYRRADIFVLPTYHEGFPHVLWEAAAHSCPIITCAVGGIPALLEHERHGLFAPPRNAVAVVEAILRLAGDDGLRRSLVQTAYVRATQFTVEACAEKLANTLAAHWH